jgi:hypothetical protein
MAHIHTFIDLEGVQRVTDWEEMCDQCSSNKGLGPMHPEDPDDLSMDCRICAPLACDDPDKHLGVPSEYTPLANRGCHCGADLDGRDCMCFE